MSGLRAIGLVARRELQSYFLQPLAWVILTALLLLNGLNFWAVIWNFNAYGASSTELLRFFFGGILFWLPLLVSLPAIAMRLVAEERQSGTLETLLTAPVTEGQVAIGKYLAALVFFLVLWSPYVVYVFLVDRLGDIDWHAAACGFLGLVLVGGYLLSAAVAASALTRNQIVAAILGFVAVMGLFLAPFLLSFMAHDETWKKAWEYLDLLRTMDEMPRGIVDTRRLVYPLSGIVFFVFLTARLIEAAKGK